jgi:MFS family permease
MAELNSVVAPRRIEWSKVAAVVAGNAMEFYDFISFGFFAANLARVMFPAGKPGVALLLTLATAATGYFARPLGALSVGYIGDRFGRRPAMLLTFFLMGIGALGLALTPSYAQIGLAAPALVVLFRVVQGFAAGGDIGPSTAYLIETAPLKQRGFFIGLQYVSMRAGAMLSGFVGLGLAGVMSPAQLDAVGWRIAFGLGALIVPFAMLLRSRLDETLDLPEADPDAPTTVRALHIALAVLGVFGTLLTGAIHDFWVTYSVTWLHTPPKAAYWIVIAIGLTYVGGYAVGGWLADVFGRRPVKLVPISIALFITGPLFWWVAQSRSFDHLMIAAVISCLFTTLGSSAILTTLVEITPKRMRAGIVGVFYGLAVAVSFGIGPVVVTDHINRTHDLATPGYALLIGLACCLISAVGLPETRPRAA